MNWENPLALKFLPLLLLLVVWVIFQTRRHKNRLRRLGNPAVLETLLPKRNPLMSFARNTCWFIAILLIGIGLARPQWGFNWETVQRRGLDIMIVLDTSNSMLAEDLTPNRLERSKHGIEDLLKQLEGDRVGLVAFSGSSFLQCPLTIDYAAFKMTLNDIYAGIIPRGGTDIGHAMETAMESFDQSATGDKVIVLISDGESENYTAAVSEALKKRKITVFAIGVGSAEGELIPMQTRNGEPKQFLKDHQGNVVKTSLDDRTLRQIARETNGMYVMALNKDFGLDRVYDEGISTLKRAEQESRVLKRFEERYCWFLLLGFFFIGVEAALSEKKKRGNA